MPWQVGISGAQYIVPLLYFRAPFLAAIDQICSIVAISAARRRNLHFLAFQESGNVQNGFLGNYGHHTEGAKQTCFILRGGEAGAGSSIRFLHLRGLQNQVSCLCQVWREHGEDREDVGETMDRWAGREQRGMAGTHPLSQIQAL